MIVQTVLMSANLPDTFITFLKNSFKKSIIGIISIEVDIKETHTAVTLIGDNINGICMAIYQLGQEHACFVLKLNTDNANNIVNT